MDKKKLHSLYSDMSIACSIATRTDIKCLGSISRSQRHLHWNQIGMADCR